MKENGIYDDSFFRMIVESLNHEIFVCDANGIVKYMNPASVILTGRTMENAVGKSIYDLIREGILDNSVTLEVMKTHCISTKIQHVTSGRELLAVGIPLFNEEKELTHILTSAQDLEAYSNLNRDLLRKNEELERKVISMEILQQEYLSSEDLLLSGKVMESIIHTLVKVAPYDISILIEGETGVGKEGIAKMTHKLSQRNKKNFVKINCGMIPEHLFESELFGYEEGSFTGAIKGGKIGKVEMAHGGTLFLDEIGELPLAMQVKLLEFLQDHTITRVGGTKKIPVDTRIVSATHRNLKEMCEKGEFRYDLYYRLNSFPILIPPLRERQDEIIHLSQFFLSLYNRKYHTKKEFNRDIIPILFEYKWPGNIRELKYMIERLFVISEGDELGAKDLEPILGGERKSNREADGVYSVGLMPLKQAKQKLEADLLTRAYAQYGSSRKVAEVLKCDQSTVVKLRKKYNIPLPGENI